MKNRNYRHALVRRAVLVLTWPFFLGSFLCPTADSQTMIVASAHLVASTECDTGMLLELENANWCVHKKTKAEVRNILKTHVNEQIKFSYSLDGTESHKGKTYERARVWGFDPHLEIGETVVIDKDPSVWGGIIRDLSATAARSAVAVSNASADGPGTVQPQAKVPDVNQHPPSTAPAYSDSLDKPEKYAEGVNACLSKSMGKDGTIFRNNCGYRVNLVWVTVSGTRGSITLGAGDSGDGSMTNTSGAAKGQYSVYACPLFTRPVDPNDNEITRAASFYRCLR